MVHLHVEPSCYKGLKVAETLIEENYALGNALQPELGSERRLPVLFQKYTDPHSAGLKRLRAYPAAW